MRSRMAHSLAVVGIAATAFIFPVAAIAVPTTYVFREASSTVPGFEPIASITVNGTLADLPTVTNVGNAGPYDFGNLSALHFQIDAFGHTLSLNNFITPQAGGFPEWTISPKLIEFLTPTIAFEFTLSPGATLTTRGESPCGSLCIATGSWDAVSVLEPSSLSVFMATLMLAGAAFAFRRTKQTE